MNPEPSSDDLLNDGQKRVRWYRRLSVRLALLTAVAMVAFGQLSPFVTRIAATTFGLEVHKPFVIAQGDDVGMSAMDPEAVCSVPPAVVESVRAIGGVDSYLVREALVSALDEWNCVRPHSFVVTGPDLVVIDSGAPEQFAPGDQFSTDPLRAATVSFFPISTELEGLRWLCLLPHPDLFDGTWPESESFRFPKDTVVLSEAEAQRQIDRYEMISIAVAWLLPLAAALVLGILVSWLVTRRIVRLNRAASDHSVESLDRFQISGKDEIAGLGSALADARRSVSDLLHEVAEKDSQRREWFAQVSHDLRTPLTALSACLERAAPLVESVVEPETRKKLSETLGVARQDTERVHTLASDLLEAARLELPDALITEDLLPEEVVERAVSNMSPLAEREGMSLRFEPCGDAAIVRGDGGRLMRVMENLIRNAIEHANSEVIVSIETIGVESEISVLDDGPGFKLTAEGLEKGRNGNTRADSAGLGLVVVNRILDTHGSQLEMRNRPSGGASASFRLMILADASESSDSLPLESLAGN